MRISVWSSVHLLSAFSDAPCCPIAVFSITRDA
jgi:hypothetical protein